MSFSKKLASFFRLFKNALVGTEQDFTTMPVNRAILLLAIPMILEWSMESIFAIVDIYFVSELGDSKAVAIVGYTENVLSILYALAMGLGVGAMAIVARRIGEKDFNGANNAAVQAIYLAFGIATVVSIGGVLYHKEILRFIGASPEVIESGSDFALWMFAGNYSITLLFLINAVFRGAGQANIAMITLLIANLINIILDPIFIFGLGPIPAFGVMGAAIATNTGRTIGVLVQFYFLFKGNGALQINWKNIAFRFKTILSVIKVSGGSIFQFMIGSLSWIFLLRIMSRYGEDAVAGYTTALRVFIFTLLPSWGLASAAAALVGQNLGAGKPDRAETSVWKAAYYNAFYMTFITVTLLLLAPGIMDVFGNNAVADAYGVQALRYVSFGYILYGYGMVLSQALNGAGDTYTPTILNVCGFWLFQIPFAYLAAIQWGMEAKGVFLAIVLAESLMAIAAIFIFRRGKWKHVKI
jgi:putative MATE family efflux protein